jgi:transposase-like protein
MLGLRKDLQVRETIYFSESEKRQIIEDYLQSGKSKRTIWEKYTGRREEHGRILRWMREYGYVSESNRRSVTFILGNDTMSEQKMNQEVESEFENLQLKKRISELEKQLHESEMKSIAYETMIEIAERELNISIKKKFNAKPSKK